MPDDKAPHSLSHQRLHVNPQIAFEQPLNERIRMFLRIEQLIERFEYCLRGETKEDSHHALITLLEVMDLAARGDLKSELMKELKRQTANLEALQAAPGVDQESLQAIVSSHHRLIDSLHSQNGHPGGQLKNNEFLNSIKQRSVIPGGTCDFDLPAYHYWLTRPIEHRNTDLRGWLEPFQQIHAASAIILDLVRKSANPRPERAVNGFFQRNLDPDQPFQMIRVLLPREASCFPEVSAGKHRFSIRFLEIGDLASRPSQVRTDIDFSLACCSL